MGEYGEVKYIPKTEDGENPAGGMMYRRMAETAKSREGTEGAGGGRGSTMQKKKYIPPTSPLDTSFRYIPPSVPPRKYSEGNPGFDDVTVVVVTLKQPGLNTK